VPASLVWSVHCGPAHFQAARSPRAHTTSRSMARNRAAEWHLHPTAHQLTDGLLVHTGDTPRPPRALGGLRCRHVDSAWTACSKVDHGEEQAKTQPDQVQVREALEHTNQQRMWRRGSDLRGRSARKRRGSKLFPLLDRRPAVSGSNDITAYATVVRLNYIRVIIWFRLKLLINAKSLCASHNIASRAQ
jgi:hypothetical protein